MHPTVREFVRNNIASVDHGRVLEVGAYNVNGGIRDLFVKCDRYITSDMRSGPGVDVVVNAERLEVAFGQRYFHVVVTTEMLEHALDWHGAVLGMDKVLRGGGTFLLTTRSPGFPLHDYPGDHWRFTGDDLRKIYEDCYNILILETDTHPGHPGIFMLAEKKSSLNPDLVNEIKVSPVALERVEAQ